MKKTALACCFAPMCALVFVAFAAYSAVAEEVLGPMAGTGGVGRDAERRALAPAASEVPEVAPEQPPEAAPSKIDARYEQVKGTVIGPVDAVKIYGSTEFAEREGIAAKILFELCDENEPDGPKTLEQITSAIVRVRQALIKKGFYLVRIMLVGDGMYDAQTKTLVVRVEEGRFGKLNITFNGEDEEGTWYSRKQILKRFKDIEEGDSFDYSRLRGVLFDANSHPDLTIDTDIGIRQPMPTEGEGLDRRMVRYADMDLNVRDSIPLHMVLEINNYGMEEVDEWQTSLTVQYLNLTKNDDVLTISPAMSFNGDLMSVAGSYMMPHEWWRGGNTTIYGGYSYLDVDNIVPRLDLEGSGYFLGLQHSESIYDDDRHLLAVSIGLLYRYIEDKYTAMNIPLKKRGASILPISLALSYTGKKADFLGGRNFATIQLVYNLMNGGDSLDEMWADAEENYWLFRWQIARLQPIFGWYDEQANADLHQWMLFLKLEGQYTDNNLIPVEKLSLGGYNCLRGYHARGYIGDYGLYGTAEIRTPILVDAISAIFGDRTNKTPIDRLQFLGFLDYGYVAYNDLPSGYDEDEFLASIGLGLRMAYTKYSQIRCDFAVPMVNGNNKDDDDYELYFSMQFQF